MSSSDAESPDSSQSQRSSGRRRSNSIGMCPLPSIPEYPGYQNLKGTKSLPSKLHSSLTFNIHGSKGNGTSQKSDSTVAIHTLAQWSLQFQSIAGLSGDYMLPDANRQFHDKSLEDYFHERLMELKHRPVQAARPSC